MRAAAASILSLSCFAPAFMAQGAASASTTAPGTASVLYVPPRGGQANCEKRYPTTTLPPLSISKMARQPPPTDFSTTQ